MAPIYTTGVTGVQTASVCSFAPGAGLVTFRQTFVYSAKGRGCACASLPREETRQRDGDEPRVGGRRFLGSACSDFQSQHEDFCHHSRTLHGSLYPVTRPALNFRFKSFLVSTTVPRCS